MTIGLPEFRINAVRPLNNGRTLKASFEHRVGGITFPAVTYYNWAAASVRGFASRTKRLRALGQYDAIFSPALSDKISAAVAERMSPPTSTRRYAPLSTVAGNRTRNSTSVASATALRRDRLFEAGEVGLGSAFARWPSVFA